jgi:hypothetical protein
VVDSLGRFGFGRVVELQVREEDVRFTLPQELMQIATAGAITETE